MTTTVLKLQFGNVALMQPLRSNELARRWLLAQLEEMDIPDFSVNDNLRKVLLMRGGYGMEVYFEVLEVTFLQETMIPKLIEVVEAVVQCSVSQMRW